MPGFHPKSLALELVLPVFFFFAEDVTDLLVRGPIAIIAPHQDDDILSCGAAIAIARRAGVAVKVFFVTDGSASSVSETISPKQLSAMRRVEAVQALGVLGCAEADIVFLNIPDNHISEHLPRIETLLAHELATLQPAFIFSPYGVDPHPDHAAAAVAIDHLVQTGAIRCRIFEYPRFQAQSAAAHLLRPSLRKRLRRVRASSLVQLKREALARHRTQCERLTDEPGWNVLEPHWTRMFFKPFELFVEKAIVMRHLAVLESSAGSVSLLSSGGLTKKTVSVPSTSGQKASELRVALLTNSLSPHSLALCECIANHVSQFEAFLSASIDDYHGFPSVQPKFGSSVQRSINFPPLRRKVYGAWQPMELHIPYDTYRQLKAYNPDVVISVQLGIRTLLSVLYRQRRPHVRLILWATLSERTEEDRNWIRRITRRWILRRVDCAFVNGKSGEDYLRKLGYVGPTSTIPYAIDDTPFRSDMYQPAAGLSRVLYAGQLVQQKGLRAFCSTLDRWCLEHPLHRVEFTLAGDGPERKVLASLATAPNLTVSILAKMPQDELARQYRKADLFAFPTLGDEWGVVVNEAMIAGVPVLGSIHSQAVTELVQEGTNGWLFDPLDVVSIHDSLTRALLTSPERLCAMSHAAQATIAEISPARVAERAASAIADVYNAAHSESTARV